MKKGEIWAVELPEGKGHEQKGERPALVLGKANALTIIVPFTTNLDRAKLPFTEHIPRTPENGLSSDSIALVFQLSSMDESRFKRRTGELTKEQQDAIDKMILELFKISIK